MNKETEMRALNVWRNYVENGENVTNANQEYSHQEIDEQRKKVIPEVKEILNNFLSGDTQLEEFKTLNDSINKRHRLWGFKGINGQMFFNILTKTCINNNKLTELDYQLKKSLPVPESAEHASEIIKSFVSFVKSLLKYFDDQRGAPKVGSINFFLSYFWQIQAPEIFPIYYTSMIDALAERNIWFPKDTNWNSYFDFFNLNHRLLRLFSEESGRNLTLWDVEHAFWFQSQKPIVTPISGQKNKEGKIAVTPKKSLNELPDSYIPPVVSILPQLALNDPELAELCKNLGRSIDKVFEDRIDILMQMLGFETEPMGQGHGRVPDGVAICREFHYAIIYDAKVRQSPYTMGTDERAIREYINKHTDILRKQGIRFIYFMVISSSFSGDHDDVIRNLKMDTDAREILLVESTSLVALLEAKLKDPVLTLGPEGIQRLFASSGILTEADVNEFRGL